MKHSRALLSRHERLTWYFLRKCILSVFVLLTVSYPIAATRNGRTAERPRKIRTRELRFAVCISGQVRSLAQQDHRSNFIKTFINPLRGAHVDTFLHFDEDFQTANPSVLQAISDDFRPVILRVESIKCDARWCFSLECVRKGYEQFKRLELIMADVVTQESVLGLQYSFVLRIRPDMLLITTLPSAHCWFGLRRDVIWDTAAKFYDPSTNVTISEAANTDFVADFFHVIPRELAEDFLFGISKSYESCIPFDGNRKPKSILGCGKLNERWLWNECRVLSTLQMMNAQVGRFDGQDLVRCAESTDEWCSTTYLQSARGNLSKVSPRDECFTQQGYKTLS